MLSSVNEPEAVWGICICHCQYLGTIDNCGYIYMKATFNHINSTTYLDAKSQKWYFSRATGLICFKRYSFLFIPHWCIDRKKVRWMIFEWIWCCVILIKRKSIQDFSVKYIPIFNWSMFYVSHKTKSCDT